jgi:hypothetical protein
VLKDLGSGGTLPGANAVTLPVGTLIRTLAARKMSMMTRTIISQVLHRRVHLRTLDSRDFDSTEDEEPHSRQSPAKSMEVAGEELDNQQAAPNAEAHVFALERESSQD